jgi:hypothetical protein
MIRQELTPYRNWARGYFCTFELYTVGLSLQTTFVANKLTCRTHFAKYVL